VKRVSTQQKLKSVIPAVHYKDFQSGIKKSTLNLDVLPDYKTKEYKNRD